MSDKFIQLVGGGAMQKRFERLSRSVINRVALHKRIAIGLIQEIDSTFKTETHEGKKWLPLSEVTKILRRHGKGKGTPKILQDTNRLRGSFSPQHHDTRFKADNFMARVGTNVEYAYKHEFGEGVPKRRMLPSRKRTLSIAIGITDDYIIEKIKTAGLK